MACRRSLSTKAALFTRWYHPSLSHISQHHDTDDAKYQPPCVDQVHSAAKIFLQQHVYNQNTYRTYRGIGAQYGYSKYFSYSPFLSVVGLPFCRQMSTTTGEGSDSVDYISDIAEVLTDKTVEVVSSQAPAINEVALAAADSAFPVAALQYLIDALHSLTGLNWWASIAITTVLIRGATLPFLINQLKATSKLNMMLYNCKLKLSERGREKEIVLLLSAHASSEVDISEPCRQFYLSDLYQLIRPRLEEIKQVQESGMDPTAVAQGQKQMTALLKEHGVSPFTPLKGLLIQGPIFISFFFAIQNMVEKVPSFKVGGALWFTDLTTPDSLYILPVLTSLSFLITVECNMQEGLEGNPIAGTMKSFSRVLALLAIPFTAAFPKALFCYWMTANLFSLSYGLVLKHPEVRNFLDLPQALPPTTSNSPSTSTLKQYHTAEEPKQSSELAKCTDRRISSSSILRQRIRNLENQVKARKKNKKL